MELVCYREGVYICIESPNYEDYKLSINNINGEKASHIYLYGRRVFLNFYSSWEYPYFHIDGIPIISIEKKTIKYRFSLSQITTYLNSIEANGVDAFLENYKKSIEFLYGELKEMNQKTESLLTSEQDDSEIKNLLSEIEKIRELLFSILAILFTLYSYMTAGLENERVISVCQSIMDSLS